MKPNPEDPKYWKNERHFKTLEYIEALEKYITDWCNHREGASFKVTIKLKRKQYDQKEGLWLCTVNGEKKIVSARTVNWICPSMSEARKSFEMNEISSYGIEKIK